jgi:hypothetical protein
MDQIKLPQHAVDRLERCLVARFSANAGKHMFDDWWRDRLRPPTMDRTFSRD